MPLYEYKCEKCEFEFEELVYSEEGSLLIKCKKCGAGAKKKISSFSSVVQGSPNESIDVKIGREANKRWQMYYDKQSKRRAGQTLKEIKVPKISGKYQPVMALGDKKDIENRKDYSTSLQKHRQEREKRGQGQFSESGSF